MRSKPVVLNTGKIETLVHVSGSAGRLVDAANGNLTNVRTNTANVLDGEGSVYYTALANEIRYKLARRVEQNISKPENFADASWSIKTSVTVASGVSDPFGGTAAFTLTATADSGNYQTGNLLKTGYKNVMCWVRRRTGTGAVNMVRPDAGTFQEILLDSTWRIVKYPYGSSAGTNSRFGFSFATNGDAIDVFFPMNANVQGRTADFCLEYVSKGNSAVYNSGLDGVQYYSDYMPYSGIHVWGDSTVASRLLLWLYQLFGKSYSGGVGGETSTQVKTRFLADTNQATRIQIISCGTNNFTDPTTVKSDIAAMVAAIPHSRYVILSPYNSNVQGVGTADYTTFKNLCSDLAALYPNNYFDVRTYIVNQYDPGQPQDVTDFANDVTPSSLRGDAIHLNDAGNRLAALAIYDFMVTHGMTAKTQLPGPITILHEGATTNLATNARDFTNAAWVKTNISAVKDATGIDGVQNSASTLTASAGNGTALQTITSASSQRITGCWIKRKTGTGVINMTQDNGSTWTPVTVTSSWTFVQLPAVTSANPVFGLQIVTNTDAIYVDYFQHELGAYITSPIDGSRSTDAIRLPYSANKNFVHTKGIVILKVKMKFANSASNKSLFAANTGATDFIYDNGSGGIALGDGTNTATAAVGGWTTDDILLIGACYDDKAGKMSIHVSKNGGAWIDSSDTTYDGAFPAGSNLVWCSSNTDTIEIMSTKIYRSTKGFYKMQNWIKNRAASEAV